MIKDILREMRGPFYKVGRSNARLDKETMKAMSSFADRIEAAEENGYRALQAHLKKLEDAYVKLVEENAKLLAALKPVLECECEPSTPTPWKVSPQGRIFGHAVYQTTDYEELNGDVETYGDDEDVCECFWHDRYGINPEDGKEWQDKERMESMLHANERAIINAVNAVCEAKKEMEKSK